MKLIYIFLSIIIITSCRKELDISEFSFNFSNYSEELRIEALILPIDSTSIVRVDKSFLINDTELYDCRDNDYGTISQDSCNTFSNSTWHGTENDLIADCGNWNPFIHDIGTDGLPGDPLDEDGDCENWTDTDCREEDSQGENNGIPDCGEPNIDNLAEIVTNVHYSDCQISISKINDNGLDSSCELEFNNNAGHFFEPGYTETGIFDNIEIISYSGYIPKNECDKSFWSDYQAQYSFYADCGEDFGIIQSKAPISLPQPVIFFDKIDSLSITECETYECLINTSSIINLGIYDSLYYARYSQNSSLFWATINPSVVFQAVQYMYNSNDNEYYYYHGHPAFANGLANPEAFQSTDIIISSERIVSEFYDGEGNGVWDDAELRTNNQGDCSYNQTYIIDSQGGFCDTGNGYYDIAELYADENNNGQWDSSEYFIDTGDDIPEVDKYYYQIFTFSESYKNYYFNNLLYLDDPERTNLRDEDNNPIMGSFGAMSGQKMYFRIIDCTAPDIFLNQNKCEDNNITKSVCEWHDNISLEPCYDYEGPACIPIDFTTEYCQ